MKKIFLENLPLRGKFINWKNSIGYTVKFIYNSIQGEIKIINYYKIENKHYLKIQYKLQFYDIKVSSFKQCHLGCILGIKISNYRYKIGDIITNVNSGKL